MTVLHLESFENNLFELDFSISNKVIFCTVMKFFFRDSYSFPYIKTLLKVSDTVFEKINNLNWIEVMQKVLGKIVLLLESDWFRHIFDPKIFISSLLISPLAQILSALLPRVASIHQFALEMLLIRNHVKCFKIGLWGSWWFKVIPIIKCTSTVFVDNLRNILSKSSR